jgi:hypothetical protein
VLSANAPLLFDERLHGYASGATMWSVLPGPVHAAIWIALAVLLLAVAGSAFRSAPPVVLEAPRLRDSSAYVASMAALLRRAGAAPAAVARFATDAEGLARVRPRAAARPEIASRLARLEELCTQRASNAGVLDAAKLNAYVRKELA